MMRGWGAAAKALHWGMAALILVQVPAGYLMSYTYGLMQQAPSVAPLQHLAAQLHHTIGLLILLLAVVRLGARLRAPVPEGPYRGWHVLHIAARANQALLYGLLLVLPLSGWAAVSVVAGEPIWFFTAPHLVPGLLAPRAFDAPLGYVLLARIHIYAVWLGAVLVALHVTAALWHHFVRRDGVLRRMWPLGGG